jgi:hypothetical protein
MSDQERLFDEDERLERLERLAAIAKREIPKELARRGLTGCSTCTGWPETVVHLEYRDGERRETWCEWEPHEGKCPKCEREPRVLTIRLAYVDGAL